MHQSLKVRNFRIWTFISVLLLFTGIINEHFMLISFLKHFMWCHFRNNYKWFAEGCFNFVVLPFQILVSINFKQQKLCYNFWKAAAFELCTAEDHLADKVSQFCKCHIRVIPLKTTIIKISKVCKFALCKKVCC